MALSILIRILHRQQQSSQNRGLINHRELKLAQLVNLNRQDLRSYSSNQMTSQAGPGFKMDEDQLHIKIVAVPILCNAYTQIN